MKQYQNSCIETEHAFPEVMNGIYKAHPRIANK